MKFLSGLFLLALLLNPTVLFDFNESAEINRWQVVDDVVMGGVSSGNFELSPEGHGLFYGEVSLENGGGFSSIRYRFQGTTVTPDTNVRLRLKGDGKPYQFLVKHDVRSYYSYTAEFQTTGDWQVVEIPLSEMKPEFRGNLLNQANFAHNQIQEVHIQIANGKEESFRLLIDEIMLVEE
ncbi:MAG: CIA30 family protein [Balneolaceae bacterium]|nr:CIA30 family protein [Balneolaceae bacterium]